MPMPRGSDYPFCRLRSKSYSSSLGSNCHVKLLITSLRSLSQTSPFDFASKDVAILGTAALKVGACIGEYLDSTFTPIIHQVPNLHQRDGVMYSSKNGIRFCIGIGFL